MSLALRVLFWVAAAGTATSSIYCLMVVAAAVRFALRKRREERAEMDFLPPVSVFKPMHGTEAGMEKNLVTFFEQEYPEFELLFCARQETDEGLKVARQVAERYPAVKARFVTCGEPTPQFHNAKVFSLAKLESVAQYDVVVSSDADVRVTKDYLRRMVQNLKQPEMGFGFVFLPRDSRGRTPESQIHLSSGRGRQERRNEFGCDGGGHARRNEVCTGADDGDAKARL